MISKVIEFDEVKQFNNSVLYSSISHTIMTTLMNEIELVFFSIYIQRFPYKGNDCNLSHHLLILALTIKVLLCLIICLFLEILQ